MPENGIWIYNDNIIPYVSNTIPSLNAEENYEGVMGVIVYQ